MPTGRRDGEKPGLRPRGARLWPPAAPSFRPRAPPGWAAALPGSPAGLPSPPESLSIVSATTTMGRLRMWARTKTWNSSRLSYTGSSALSTLGDKAGGPVAGLLGTAAWRWSTSPPHLSPWTLDITATWGHLTPPAPSPTLGRGVSGGECDGRRPPRQGLPGGRGRLRGAGWGGLYLGMSDKDPAGVGGGRLPVVSALRLKP